ncbi:MAG TPA: O-antigen ligase family protein [Pyrinomonadaceae bacterium]|nr:O-antigen ligase family protein [Pyrinomonadaceae bacterium]
MPLRPELPDYESLTNPAKARSKAQEDEVLKSSSKAAPVSATPVADVPAPPVTVAKAASEPSSNRKKLIRRGHVLSYIGLFLFTAVLYFRPYELFPALSSLDKLAFVLAIITLVIFFPSQIASEGNLTYRPREINLVLLLCVAGLISIITAINPAEAWKEFNDVFIKAVLMFIVIVNVLRSKSRLRWLIYLAFSVTILLSYNAIRDYRAGNFLVEGDRIKGLLGGMFGNPNDLALHFVTMAPIAVGLMFASRKIIGKLIFATVATLILMANVVTFSRGGFLGLLATAVVLIWKIGRKRRVATAIIAPVCFAIFIAVAPGNYGQRLLSIFVRDLDPMGTANTRQEILNRSILVSIRNPITGIGMGNFHTVSLHETVTHNAFTQVSAEMGTTALIIYLMFLTAPIRRLRGVERRAADDDQFRFYYYLSIGLQASLVGYMVSGFFASVAYQWYAYYLVGYSVALWRMFEAEAPVAAAEAAPARVIAKPDLYKAFQPEGATPSS